MNPEEIARIERLANLVIEHSYLSNKDKQLLSSSFEEKKRVVEMIDILLNEVKKRKLFIATDIVTSTTKGKTPAKATSQIKAVTGLPGSGKSSYIDKICQNTNLVPSKNDNFDYVPGMSLLNLLLPPHINNNEAKRPSLYSFIKATKETAGFIDHARDYLVKENYNIALEVNPTDPLVNLQPILKNSQSSLTILVVPDRIREVNILYRYEKSLSQFLETEDRMLPTSSLVPINNNLKHDKEALKSLSGKPRLCRKMGIKYNIINPITNSSVKNIMDEINRPLNKKELEYLRDKKLAIMSMQKKRQASVFDQTCCNALDRPFTSRER